LAELKPKHVNVTAILGLVRNSVGSNAYVSDEVLYSRAGLRVLVGNTDAEGRMVMTDPLCECKERVLAERKSGVNTPSRLFTVATLTGTFLSAHCPDEPAQHHVSEDTANHIPIVDPNALL